MATRDQASEAKPIVRNMLTKDYKLAVAGVGLTTEGEDKINSWVVVAEVTNGNPEEINALKIDATLEDGTSVPVKIYSITHPVLYRG